MAKRRKKYIPSIKVLSDDLVVIDEEGNEHRPHEGEWVVFRKGVPLSVMRVARRAANAQDFEELTEEDLAKLSEAERSHYERERREMAAEIGDLSEDLIHMLARQILDWSWTSEVWSDELDDFVPYPRPRDNREAFVETLWNMEDYERDWLQEHMTDGANAPKN